MTLTYLSYHLTYLILAPTQSPSYADNSPGNVNLPLSMDPVLAVVTNASGQQVSVIIREFQTL